MKNISKMKRCPKCKAKMEEHGTLNEDLLSDGKIKTTVTCEKCNSEYTQTTKN